MITSAFNDRSLTILVGLAQIIDSYESKHGAVTPAEINRVLELLRESRDLLVTNDIDYKSM